MSLSQSQTLPPHPPITPYYGSLEGKSAFVRNVFNTGAADYDRIERLMSLGSGSWYRRQALQRAGLGAGMQVLDVAIGTGLVAREEIALAGDRSLIIGLDPSAGMISRAVRDLQVRGVLGIAEQLPFADATFDFVSMGYALRHLGDLRPAFNEFARVLRPGGRVCIFEISRPRSRVGRVLLSAYMRGIVPALTRLTSRKGGSKKLWEYYWDTINACVPGEHVVETMRQAGFQSIDRHVVLGIFSEFTGQRPL